MIFLVSFSNCFLRYLLKQIEGFLLYQVTCLISEILVHPKYSSFIIVSNQRSLTITGCLFEMICRYKHVDEIEDHLFCL